MKLKDLKIGNFSYLDIKYPKDSMPELVRKSKENIEEEEIENINKALKELHYYQYCNKKYDDECEHCHCIYSVLWFGSEFKATCGRKGGNNND